MIKALLLSLVVAPFQLYAATPAPQEQPVKAELVFERVRITPGQPAKIGIKFTIPKPWHIYWKDPGDSGLPTKITVTGPDGLHAGEILWPPHVTFTQPGDIVGYGYESDVSLMVPVTLAQTNEKQTTLTITTRWLSCSPTLCIPGSAKFTKDFDLIHGENL